MSDRSLDQRFDEAQTHKAFCQCDLCKEYLEHLRNKSREAAPLTSKQHTADLLERLRGPWLPESVDRERKQAANEIERLERELVVANEDRENLRADIDHRAKYWAQFDHVPKGSAPETPPQASNPESRKPCPFCDSTDLEGCHKPDPSPPSYPDGVWVIECHGCGALGPFCEEHQNATKAWNDRAAAETTCRTCGGSGWVYSGVAHAGMRERIACEDCTPDETNDRQSRTIKSLCDRLDEIHKITCDAKRDGEERLTEIAQWTGGFMPAPVEESSRRKLSATERLHNICDALSDQADESQFSREEWDRIDKETVRLQNSLRHLAQYVAHNGDTWVRDTALAYLKGAEPPLPAEKSITVPTSTADQASGHRTGSAVVGGGSEKTPPARADKLEFALRGLYWDNVDYLTLNKLGGMNNHWMRAAREALGMDPDDTRPTPSEPELRQNSPEIQFADVFKEAERGNPVNTQDLINALWWRVRNQRREIAKLHKQRAVEQFGQLGRFIDKCNRVGKEAGK